jgi:WD40 repeat protein
VRAILTGHTGKIEAVAYSTSGEMIASASKDGSVRLWDVRTGVDTAVFARKDPVYAVAFSPDGQLLASGDADGNVILWHVETRKAIATLKHDQLIWCLAFTADGKLLVSRTQDSIVWVWDIAERKNIRHLGSYSKGWYSCLLIPGEGEQLATNLSVKEKIQLWDLASGELRRNLEAEFTWQDSHIQAMAVTPDGELLAGTTIFGNGIVFWATKSGQFLGSAYFPPHTMALAFSPDGKTLASAHAEGEVRLWDSRKLIPHVAGEKSPD